MSRLVECPDLFTTGSLVSKVYHFMALFATRLWVCSRFFDTRTEVINNSQIIIIPVGLKITLLITSRLFNRSLFNLQTKKKRQIKPYNASSSINVRIHKDQNKKSQQLMSFINVVEPVGSINRSNYKKYSSIITVISYIESRHRI